MNILSFNPSHDGAVACVKDGRLLFSIEAEKDSNYRYSRIGRQDILNALWKMDEAPDVICIGGWWPHENTAILEPVYTGYRGIETTSLIVQDKNFLGRPTHFFSSSHERSHLLCAFGMSGLPKGTPCYVLLYEGEFGSFYEIDENFNIIHLGEVMNEPGHRYASLYDLADPTFPKNAPFSRLSDAGKLMALASYSKREKLLPDELELLDFLMSTKHLRLGDNEDVKHLKYYNVGFDNQDFRDFAGIFSHRVFEAFYAYAEKHLRKGFPLVIGGGCGLNCDWNSKWAASGLFPKVLVSPVTNDSGSAIGTALDAQLFFTGDPTMMWNVYSGEEFNLTEPFNVDDFDVYEADYERVADMLANDLIFGWINGRYEIGPRALGNRSILAAPFKASTRVRLNNMKQREQYRPIAPVCLEADAAEWFGCTAPSPYMLFTFTARTERLAAVTHVNGSARLQTVSEDSNPPLFNLLMEFKQRTGYGVLCNTSLNFKGRGFINSIDDLALYTSEHDLDGFVVDGKMFMKKKSELYKHYLRKNV